jgi:hypothetical protein
VERCRSHVPWQPSTTLVSHCSALHLVAALRPRAAPQLKRTWLFLGKSAQFQPMPGSGVAQTASALRMFSVGVNGIGLPCWKGVWEIRPGGRALRQFLDRQEAAVKCLAHFSFIHSATDEDQFLAPVAPGLLPLGSDHRAARAVGRSEGSIHGGPPEAAAGVNATAARLLPKSGVLHPGGEPEMSLASQHALPHSG